MQQQQNALCLLTALACISGGVLDVQAAEVPTDNPVASHYKSAPDVVPDWIGGLPWDRVVNISDFKGDNDTRLAKAQQTLDGKGGVVFFPAGTYAFENDILLEQGVVLRGADPKGHAKQKDYQPGTRFEFVKYQPSMKGSGTPIDTAFRKITLGDAATVGNCGVVNIAINRAHIYFPEAEQHDTAANRLIFGCLLRNTAAADPTVPNAKYGHQPHQRFTARHRAAIHVFAGENLFVANNRIAKSGDDNFTVERYSLIHVLDGHSQRFRLGSKQPHKVITIEEGVEFDYDNRPGIYANYFGIGAVGGELPDGTPQSHPYGFRKGLVIRDNYIYCSGRSAVAFCGDGTYCGFNVIRFPHGVVRPTTTGLVCSDGSATNDNRAMTMRGYRWVCEGNDYEVHSNMAFNPKIKINDGEGIMHENHHNSAVKDGKIIGNTGNRYLCLWVTNIDGLEIRGNKVTADRHAIHILGRGRTVRNVTIADNELTAGEITVTSDKAQNITITGNRYAGAGRSHITVTNLGWVEPDNKGFDSRLHVPKQKRRK